MWQSNKSRYDLSTNHRRFWSGIYVRMPNIDTYIQDRYLGYKQYIFILPLRLLWLPQALYYPQSGLTTSSGMRLLPLAALQYIHCWCRYVIINSNDQKGTNVRPLLNTIVNIEKIFDKLYQKHLMRQHKNNLVILE